MPCLYSRSNCGCELMYGLSAKEKAEREKEGKVSDLEMMVAQFCHRNVSVQFKITDEAIFKKKNLAASF